MARLLHGRPLAERINAETHERAAGLARRSVLPHLAVVSVGADPAALTYTERLTRSGHAVGVRVKNLPITPEKILKALRDKEKKG